MRSKKFPNAAKTSRAADPGRDPIAIVGIGCRFPGAPDVESFWRVLRDEVETIGDYPGGRSFTLDQLYAHNMRIATRRGGFLRDLDRFDAGFFGISPREAALLDPQQRLLLEMSWNAVEDAGIPIERLAGSRTGVFAGIWTSDYEACISEQTQEVDFYATTGGGRYSASGRVAYFFDLRGPALTLDTACSSSLAAVHLACQSLHCGESEMALAGGANVVLRPEVTFAYSTAGMLAPDGRSKFGDAAADGYVRSEGAGVVLLKPLSRALADGNPIYALIRGSAVSNDGRSSGLLVLPSREGQRTVLTTAMEDASVSPSMIDYIEAHGTGTLMGDPIEIETIGRLMADHRRERPCAIGSVKTNIGHTESAAGIAGLIKVALSLERNTLPASLHFHTPNPNIAWQELPVLVPTHTASWPGDGPVRMAGVSGFGITGTNAHVILQNAQPPTATNQEGRSAELFLLSAHAPEALRATARAWQERLATDCAWPASFSDLAYTVARRRTHQDHRLAIAASTRQELQERLAGWLDGQPQPRLHAGRRTAGAHRVVFVFPGQGGQWVGMGRSLFHEEPAFRKALEACDAAIYPYTGWSAIERLMAPAAEDALTEIEVVQPLLFAVMVALAELWRSWGVEPEAVVGHSMGEVAAAAVSGALSLSDAAAVICHRSRLMKRASGRGLMAVTELPFEAANTLAGEYGGRLSVAAHNSPVSTVLAGDTSAVEDVLATLEAQEIFCRRIKVDVASHCAHMDPFRQELVERLAGIQPRRAAIPLYSTTTGNVEDGAGLDAAYWSRNLREPVRFASAIRRLLADGFDTFLEINAHPVLLQAVEACIQHASKPAVALGSLRREQPERPELLGTLGALYTRGYPVDFSKLYPEGVCLRLPAYQWQGERHWIETDRQPGSLRSSGPHPGLSASVESSVDPGTYFWEADLKTPEGKEPVTFLIEMALAAAREGTGSSQLVLEDLELPAMPTERGGQVAITPLAAGTWRLQIAARQDAGWIPCCRCLIRLANEKSEQETREYFVKDADSLETVLRLAVKAAGDDSGKWRIRAIRRLEWHGSPVFENLTARAAVRLSEGEVNCCLELVDGTLVADIAGIQLFMAEDRQARDHLYQWTWKPGESPVATPSGPNLWIVMEDSGRFAGRLTAALEDVGDQVIGVPDAQALAETLDAVGASCRGVICPPEEGMGPPPDVDRSGKILDVVRAIAGAKVAKPPRLWLLTAGAWQLSGDPAVVEAAEAAVWGLGRAIAREHPEVACVNADLSAMPGIQEWETLAALLRKDEAEDQIAVRGSKYFLSRLARYLCSEDKPACFAPDATYLITGGTGGIGLQVARWMVETGVRFLALASRSGPDEHARHEIAALEAAGATIRVFRVDVSDETALARMMEEVRTTMPALRGIFHAAGVIDDALLLDTTREQLRRVMTAKAIGAWNLHVATEFVNLDFFVLFSSIAATLSQPGQGSYAAANAYLDGLARYRQARGLAGLSIQWGVWAATGMAQRTGAQRNFDDYRERGIGTLSPVLGLEALRHAMAGRTVTVLAAPICWPKFAEASGPSGIARAFSDLADSNTAPSADNAGTLREQLRIVPTGTARRSALERHLQRQLATVLKLDQNRIDPEKPMGSMGVDSLMALEFVRRLSATAGIRLPATAVFNFCTIQALTEEVARRMEIPLAPVAVAPVTAAVSRPLLFDTAGLLSEEEAIAALMKSEAIS